jgi:hypothetical protein
MEDLDQVSIDTAVILDEKVNERVKNITNTYLGEVLGKLISMEFDKRFNVEKEKMLMEVAITAGKILGRAADENRKPLWETDIVELGFPPVTTTHNISGAKDGVQK